MLQERLTRLPLGRQGIFLNLDINQIDFYRRKRQIFSPYKSFFNQVFDSPAVDLLPAELSVGRNVPHRRLQDPQHHLQDPPPAGTRIYKQKENPKYRIFHKKIPFFIISGRNCLLYGLTRQSQLSCLISKWLPFGELLLKKLFMHYFLPEVSKTKYFELILCQLSFLLFINPLTGVLVRALLEGGREHGARGADAPGGDRQPRRPNNCQPVLRHPGVYNELKKRSRILSDSK